MVLAGGFVGAAGAAGHRWKVLWKAGGEGDFVAEIVAAGPKDLWAFSGRYPDSGFIVPKARHWDGKKWRVVKLPARAKGGIEFAAAASSKDIWANFNQSVDSDGYAGILHWDGKTWKVSKRLPRYSSYRANEILPFGGGKAAGFFGNRLWLNDGRSWTESRADRPVISPSGGSARAIWALGEDQGSGGGFPFSAPKVYRFNGTSWRHVPVPKALLRTDRGPCLKQEPKGECSGELYPNAILVSADRVLLTATTWGWPTDNWRALVWRGGKWRALTGLRRHSVGDVESDGSGGFWAVTYRGARAQVVHVTAKGKVIQYPSPAKGAHFDRISVTPSGTVFAAGYVIDAADNYAGRVWRLDR
ncbi:hypothetical protein [Actinocorallia sp. A-T 12471]|uniref:hypothetical protein n=1 Tax=Actinocorallia sp. A-T 12471 TaxID=3089813 RepID=UPI0029CEE79F|nr:hypothetical protein [Actinocorallia sp. A-T 12471]MDX6743444.1 hypothetical protein [Actinocorallia sp. A-T 12471]